MVLKEKIIFDPLDLPNSDNVGSFVRSADSSLITSTNSGGKTGLDVSVITPITFTVGDVGTCKNVFNEVLAVASGSATNLVTYTVPIGKTAVLERVFVSGENIAKYDVFINGIKIDTGRTYFGSTLNMYFEYESTKTKFLLAASDVVTITVLHNRPSVGDFEGRIQLVEI